MEKIKMSKKKSQLIEALFGQLTEINARLSNLETGQAELTERLSKVSERLSKVSERLGQVETGQSKMTERLGQLEDSQKHHADRYSDLSSRFSALDSYRRHDIGVSDLREPRTRPGERLPGCSARRNKLGKTPQFGN